MKDSATHFVYRAQRGAKAKKAIIPNSKVNSIDRYLNSLINNK